MRRDVASDGALFEVPTAWASATSLPYSRAGGADRARILAIAARHETGVVRTPDGLLRARETSAIGGFPRERRDRWRARGPKSLN